MQVLGCESTRLCDSNPFRSGGTKDTPEQIFFLILLDTSSGAEPGGRYEQAVDDPAQDAELYEGILRGYNRRRGCGVVVDIRKSEYAGKAMTVR